MTIDEETNRATELLEIVTAIREHAPDMLLDHAIRLGIATQQSIILDDLIIVLGDIADALNDIRPNLPRGSLH